MPDFIRIGTRVINLALVAEVDLDGESLDDQPCVTVRYCASSAHGLLCGLRFYGAEADALRRYLRGEATIVAEVAEAVDA